MRNQFLSNVSGEMIKRQKLMLAIKLRSAAAGNRIALSSLEQEDQSLHTFLHYYLNDAQREILSLESVGDLVSQIDAMGSLGFEAGIYLNSEDFNNRCEGSDEFDLELNFDEDENE